MCGDCMREEAFVTGPAVYAVSGETREVGHGDERIRGLNG